MNRIIVFFSHIFTEPALREVHRRRPAARLERMLGLRAALFQYPRPFAEFISPWKNRLPVYIHHAVPVQEIVESPYDVSRVRGNQVTVAHVLCPDTHEILAREQETLRAQLHRVGARLSESTADSVLTLVPDPQARPGTFFMGRHAIAENLSHWASGIPRFPEKVLNRSGPKLLESLAALPLRIRPGDCALDLGSGMGSWTRILRESGLTVYAVDRRLPVRALRKDPGVHYHRVEAEEYLCRAPRRLNLIVNDMIMDARDSARLMTAYANRLEQNGAALMTLKLRPRNRGRVLDHSLRILRKAYKVQVLRQLYYNKNEMTALLRPRHVQSAVKANAGRSRARRE